MKRASNTTVEYAVIDLLYLFCPDIFNIISSEEFIEFDERLFVERNYEQ